MRLSRHCYDKPHRCPGWAGGGWKYPRGAQRCDNGHIEIDYSNRWKRNWTFHHCDKCDVVCWPIFTQWLDPSYWRWKLTRLRGWWQEHVTWWLQEFVVVALVRLCHMIDHIPAYRRRPDPEKGRHWTSSGWGCVLRLGTASDKLDQHWKTHIWEHPIEGEQRDGNVVH